MVKVMPFHTRAVNRTDSFIGSIAIGNWNRGRKFHVAPVPSPKYRNVFGLYARKDALGLEPIMVGTLDGIMNRLGSVLVPD